MATSDLLAELSKDTFRAAPDVEKKVVDVVLKQLDDQVRARISLDSSETRLARPSRRWRAFLTSRAFPLPSPTVPQSGDVSSLAIKCLPAGERRERRAPPAR